MFDRVDRAMPDLWIHLSKRSDLLGFRFFKTFEKSRRWIKSETNKVANGNQSFVGRALRVRNYCTQ
jgi:hypothetical protein